jgi:hypothetical protein
LAVVGCFVTFVCFVCFVAFAIASAPRFERARLSHGQRMGK